MVKLVENYEDFETGEAFMEAFSFIINFIGIWIFFSFPLFSYFALIGIYSLIFLNVGIIFWAVFAVLGFVFLVSKKIE